MNSLTIYLIIMMLFYRNQWKRSFLQLPSRAQNPPPKKKLFNNKGGGIFLICYLLYLRKCYIGKCSPAWLGILRPTPVIYFISKNNIIAGFSFTFFHY